MKDRFTRVLKGHIALAARGLPQGHQGQPARRAGPAVPVGGGLDYAHGTGHGVGSFLSVHEGPQRIAKSAGAQGGTDRSCSPGMILSNEPGYYKAGEYGIRIENLVLVEPRAIEGAEGEFFGFEVLTLVPIERRLVDPTQLSHGEIAWWNAYHARVLEVIGPQLEGEARPGSTARADVLAECTRLL